MDVDVHAGVDRRQHVEVEAVDVAAGLRDVRRVDEQDVARFERGELRDRDVLHLVLDEPRYPVDPVPEERARIRLDARDVDAAGEPAPIDVGDQQRRIAGPHLDDPARAPRVQQHEQRAGVEPAELRIAGVEVDEIGPVRQRFRVVVERPESRKGLGEELPVPVVVPVDTGDDRPLRPEALAFRGDGRAIDDRRIEVSRRDEWRIGRWVRHSHSIQQAAHGIGARAGGVRRSWVTARSRRSPARDRRVSRPCVRCDRCGKPCRCRREARTAGYGRCAARGSSGRRAGDSPTS